MTKYQKCLKELDDTQMTVSERKSFDDLSKHISKEESNGGYAGISRRHFIQKFQEITDRS